MSSPPHRPFTLDYAVPQARGRSRLRFLLLVVLIAVVHFGLLVSLFSVWYASGTPQESRGEQLALKAITLILTPVSSLIHYSGLEEHMPWQVVWAFIPVNSVLWAWIVAWILTHRRRRRS